MDEFIQKISSYNILNNLLPGVLFAIFAQATTSYNFIQENLIIAAFVYYFIGMAISRFGSLVIEPIFKWLKFLEFTDYSEFIAASKKDAKLELLSESNNTYRTLCAMFVVLGIFKAYELIGNMLSFSQGDGIFLLFIALFVLFSFSHRKQTAYITKRVKANL
jgi:F0F1-type ATP synthase assembly protein I